MLYFIFPNALMRIIIWFCYQPLLDKNLAGSSVFFFLVLTMHLISYLTIFAV